MPTPEARAIAREVLAERDAQDQKWGRAQLADVPDGTGGGTQPLHFMGRSDVDDASMAYAELVAQAAKDDTDTHADDPYEYGPVTYRHILLEEVFEALAEAEGTAELRAELVQVAAVAMKWIEAFDIRTGNTTRSPQLQLRPAHLRAAYLLAEHQFATHERLFRAWQTKIARTEQPWPYITTSGLRTRVNELVKWGLVEHTGHYGRTIANRPSKSWALAGEGHRRAAIADGSAVPVPAVAPGSRDTFRALLDEAGDDLTIRVALIVVAAAAGIAS